MALDNDIRTFQQIPLFRLLEPEAVRLLAFSAETKLLRASDVLVRANSGMDGGFLLTKGSLAVFDNADQLGAPRQVVRAPGLIGELSLIAPTEFSGSIVAREPSTTLRISRSVFHRVLQEYPASARAIRTTLMERLKGLSQDLATLQA